MWQLSNKAHQTLNTSLKEQMAERAIPLNEVSASQSFINMRSENAEPLQKDGVR